MRQIPTIAAAIALAAGPALVPALSLADEARAETPKAAEEGGVAVSQTLATLPGTSIPAVGVGVAGALEGVLYADEPRVRTAAAAWAPSLGVALTDHNAIGAGVAAVFGDNVVAIVDHHHDERRHCSDGEGVPGVPRLREIDPLVGSSCSLLVELMSAYLLSCRPLPLCGLLLGTIIKPFTP